MTVLQKLWRLMGFGGVSAFTWPAHHAPADRQVQKTLRYTTRTGYG